MKKYYAVKKGRKRAFGTDTEVEDPNFQSEAVYRRVAQHIEEGCRRKLHEFR